MYRWLAVTGLAVLLANAAYPAEADASTDVARVVDNIPESAFEGPVLMVGESHRRPTSHAFTLALIRRALHHDRCVTLALEIPVDQADTWRSLANEPEAIGSMSLPSIHDSPSLRRLLQTTARLAHQDCLKLNAIDSIPTQSIDHPGGRDFVMAEHIADLVTDDRLVIALVGSNHAPRHIDWDYDAPGQSTTFYLAERGIDAYVILQDWVETEAPRVLAGDGEAAVSAYNRLQWFRSVVPATTFTRYADRLIQWPDIGTSEFGGSE
jgi:hypothetical protein